MPRTAVRTYLFADLRDYTAFVEARGDTAATRLIREFRRIVRASIRSRSGAEIKTEGDSFYVVFPLPGDAIRAAIAIQGRTRRYGELHPDFPIRVAIGINAGEAVEHEDAYVGSAVNIASRLAAQAKPGQILVTDTVWGLVRTSAIAPMSDEGTSTLKGVTHAIHVWSVVLDRRELALAPVLKLPALMSAAPAAAGAVFASPEVVGRDDELRVLRGELAAAGTGESRVVALVGEAGIGKSRLAREIATHAHGEGFYVLAGRAHARGALPYEAFVAALRPYVRARGVEALRRVLGSLANEIGRILPELATSTPTASIAEGERRDRFFRTVQLLLEDASAQRPVLVVLEDIHDGDTETFELLRYLVATLRASICVLMTCRSDALASDGRLRALFRELERERHVTRVTLGPLAETHVARMIRVIAPNADATVARAIEQRSRGVPFYVEELLKTTAEGRAADAVPQTVRDAVALRLARVAERYGTAVVELLQAAALVGIPVSRALLDELGEGGVVDAALGAAIDTQLIERTTTQRELYQFRHPLTREAVEATIAAPSRRAAHGRVARALERTGGAASAPTLLARHYAEAGEREQAFRYSMNAAASARRLGAVAIAIEQLSAGEAQASSAAERAEVLEHLAEANVAAGRPDDSLAAIARARAEPLEDLARARLDVLAARALRLQGRTEEARAAIGTAITTLERAGGASLAAALVIASEVAWVANDMPRAVELGGRALALAEAAGDAQLVVAALTALGAAHLRSAPERSVASLEQAVQRGTSASLHSETAAAWLELSRAQLLRGDFDAAAHAAGNGLELAREHGLEFAQSRLLAQLTTIHVNHGDYAEARQTAEQAVALARPGTLSADSARISLGHVLTNQGEYDAALAIFDGIAPRLELWDTDRRVTYLAYRTQALLSAGRIDEAEECARKAVTATMSTPGMGMTAFLNAAAVVEARRDAKAAAELGARFEAYFAGRDTGPVRAVRAEIAAVREWCARRPAAAAYDRAADAYDAIGASVHALYRRSSAHIARLEDPALMREARLALERLRAQLERHGALRYVALIDAALKRRRRAARQREEMLSGRDLRIALLLATGATNQRIARELRSSRADAERRVRDVLAKLGVGSRSQVASWALTRMARDRVTAR